MAITVVGTGVQEASDTLTASITAAFPASYSAVADDLAVVFACGRPTSGSPNLATPSGWTLRGGTSSISSSGTDMRIMVFYRKLQAGDAAPVFTVSTEYAGPTAGVSVQMVVYRGVHTTTPFDVADRAWDSNGVNQATFTPGNTLTTVTNGAMVLHCAMTNDTNALALNTPNGWTLDLGGADYDTTVGGDFSVGVANVIKETAGSVTWMVWGQTVNGNDSWNGFGLALRPAPITGSGAPTVTLSRSASGVGTLTITGSGAPAATLSVVASGTGTETFTGSGAPTVTLSVTATGAGQHAVVNVTGSGAPTVTLSVSASGTGTGPRRGGGFRRILYDPQGAQEAIDARPEWSPDDILEARPLPDLGPLPAPRTIEPTPPVRLPKLQMTVEAIIEDDPDEIDFILNVVLDLDKEAE